MVLHRGARQERHVSRRALASVESILLAGADLMLSLESLGLQIMSTFDCQRRAFSENKSGHPLVLDGPPMQVIVHHLCRKGTSAETRTDAGGPCFELVIAWQEGHDVVSGLVRQIQLRTGEAVRIAAATASVKRFLDEIDLRNEIASAPVRTNR